MSEKTDSPTAQESGAPPANGEQPSSAADGTSSAQQAESSAAGTSSSGAPSSQGASTSGAEPSAANGTAAGTAGASEAGGASQASTSEANSVSPASTTADVRELASTQASSPASTTATESTSAVSKTTSVKSHSQKVSSATGHSKSRTDTPGSVTNQAAAEPAGGSSRKTSPSAQGSSRGSSRQRKRTKLGELDLNTAKIGFLGAGKMAESTINGLIHYAKIKPGNIHVSAPSSKGLERFKAMGCHVTKRNYDIFGRYDCDIVFLCFHGYVIKHCYKLGGARPHPLTTNYIPHQRHPVYILSLVSGVSLSQIKACLLNPESHNRYVIEIHRIMMNTAVGHGLGICAIDCEPDSKKLSAPIRQLLSSIAQLENVPASQMDAACAIGGSGLAFAYYFINALADGAFKMGLSRQQAIRFASKTAQCAAQTMIESGKHPAELRDNVSSPSGAAIYGIHVLEKNDVASGVTAAVEAAHKRANDLATQEVS